ncbi:membrane protein [Pantoea stewartii subsp. indologenes]|uniref:anti-virulence regulator CigR family protein n=1 Tax=Pantoea stewartii TaxID=66269 RepID=UPI00050E71D2|nr:anti-virulence regulator CigR family protein [Pantoea stewartii]KGD84844.1 membrane protein [Pantoea stewartii subsp. indologenes]
MLTQRSLKTVFALVVGFAVFAAPVYANPGNGNGGGHGNGNGNGNGNHGTNGAHANKGQNYIQTENEHRYHKNDRQPDHVESDINFSRARALAINYGLVGYQSLPPGIAKKVARGKPLPPGIAKKNLPASMINALPHYPGYEWRAVGDDLVLIALSTAVVTAVINGVFN